MGKLPAFVSLSGLVAAVVTACGSRTGLLVPGPQGGGDDGGAPSDALPPLDVPEPPDGPGDCPDGASTLVYVISSQNELFSFYPPTATFTPIGVISCPDPGGATPFSMAVDRAGVAYVLFNDGLLFQVSTLTAACTPTPFQPGGGVGFSQTFGMGYSRAPSGTGELLYVAADNVDPAGNLGPSTLATLDTTSLSVHVIGQFLPSILQPELTGTGSGGLFAFYATNGGGDSAIGQVDRTTAAVVAQAVLPGVAQGAGWAFAFWGGDFYTFTAPDQVDTVVTRYRPSDGSIATVATTPGQTIVGAGVSTCAPQR